MGLCFLMFGVLRAFLTRKRDGHMSWAQINPSSANKEEKERKGRVMIFFRFIFFFDII